jgi:hypothetical protein
MQPGLIFLAHILPCRHAMACRWYLDTYGPQLDASPWAAQQYRPFGWAGVIAFPQFFANSYGEFGSPQVRLCPCLIAKLCRAICT